MNTYTTNSYGRTILIHLSKGEKVLESVQAEIERLGVKNGILVSAIGSLRKATIHVISTTEDYPTDVFFTVEKPIELGVAQGLIIDGVPHFHLVISEPDGEVYVGHMEPGCEVQYLAELAILELNDLSLMRKPDEFGVSHLLEK